VSDSVGFRADDVIDELDRNQSTVIKTACAVPTWRTRLPFAGNTRGRTKRRAAAATTRGDGRHQHDRAL
jgi:hypothetical protein